MKDSMKVKKTTDQNETGLTVSTGEVVSVRDLTRQLATFDYTNVSPGNVAKVGEFSKRGGVVDIWLERYKLPVRLDLIGEEIESIYLFNRLTSQKVRTLKKVYVVPFGITPILAPKWTKKAFPAEKGKYERLFLSEIQPGDLVVHIDHGVGKFVGVVDELGPAFAVKTPESKINLSRGRADRSQTGEKIAEAKSLTHQFLLVEYASNDKLFVPIEQIERVTKYIGVAGRKPALSRLGTATWERTKQKVAEDIVKYAKELLELYAKREISKRVPYMVDTPWQKTLEGSFEYQETDDQLKATADIKKDLESVEPMDRILVGDVGFGKTEVAIRTAFKVVQESKQVAILVPTTILADQHYYLFLDRLKEFPVEIALLSRFKNESEQKQVIRDLKSGKIDIVIGTHRLFSGDVEFKNLGLLIIDEEHRFGVRHKEKLKSIRPNVDVLSMSATPIPRSLQMALAKIRAMSVLKQPPIGRKPIKTFVEKYDQNKIKKAIEYEINRSGQVYYLYNNVGKIAQKTVEVATLVPKAKIVYGHGQMNGKQLEEVMDKFYSGKANVLVCTTIIGSGIDMPNVNTIIIEESHRFGLADLYQLRGRVGRSEKEAFAYLFYPKKFTPGGDALERLSAIAQATDLGSGFKIARQDLEIRGAGNLLGTAQHGNISLVGFELYIQLLAQAVEKRKK